MASVLSQLRLARCAALVGRTTRLCAVLSSLLCCTLFYGAGARAASGEGVSTPSLPIATVVQVDHLPGVSRLNFELSGPVDASAFVMAEPNRVIVDLPEINFQIDPRAGVPVKKGARRHKAALPERLISSFRFGLFAPGKSRIVIDLARPAKILRAQSQVQPNGRNILQIELADTDTASFRSEALNASLESLAKNSTPAIGSGEVVGLRGSSLPSGIARPVIVIDPGHGGIDSGAQGLSGAVEKNLVFEFSRTLQSQLEAGGRYRVLLTRSSDIFVPLAGRVKFAREANAALFISIHADTLSEGAGVSGATVYTVSDTASDKQAARLAEKENDADAAAGMDRAEDGSDVSDILFDLTRRETRAYSHVFARSLIQTWSAAGTLNKNPHRSARFVVLKAPDVPSVLLELGYLSSEKDIAVLMKPQWREKAASIMVHAVDQFFAPRVGGNVEPAPDAGVPSQGVAAALH
ncbi:MAG: N-acetylmuramoyl-L-alanine amidase [Hyphomicrobiales bacterium]|nr:N-acetylmuramoyl-L-alanine amidase [Hyphomicrobiales bacterium]